MLSGRARTELTDPSGTAGPRRARLPLDDLYGVTGVGGEDTRSLGGRSPPQTSGFVGWFVE